MIKKWDNLGFLNKKSPGDCLCGRGGRLDRTYAFMQEVPQMGIALEGDECCHSDSDECHTENQLPSVHGGVPPG